MSQFLKIKPSKFCQVKSPKLVLVIIFVILLGEINEHIDFKCATALKIGFGLNSENKSCSVYMVMMYIVPYDMHV